MQQMLYTRKGTERIIRYAFELAKQRGPTGGRSKPKVSLVDKANAVRAQELWTRTFQEVAAEYPDIDTDHAYIDAACMFMVKDPERFDVGVTTNLFGDIITDLGAEPWMPSNIETLPGWMLPDAAMPMPPTSSAPRSVMMSPNRLVVTPTSKRSGSLTMNMHAASM